ncbi:MAG: MarR family winged helix-turn-helix transcriptional regulator [Acetobacteraceae bacterium]
MSIDTNVEGEDDFNLDEYLPYRLAVAASTVSRLMGRRLAETAKLSISEWRVLSVVARAGVLSPSAIGALAAMDKVKVSRAAASLVARGLIKQTQDPNDGRGRLLRLTRKAAGIQRNLVALARTTEGQLETGLNRTEWAALKATLSRLEQHARGLGGPDSRAEAAD